MWELDCEESWVLKNWCFWTVVLEKTLESPLDCKEIQPVHSEGDQCWVFIGRTNAEAETPKLWPPHAKGWLIGKDPDAGRDWGQEKGTTEDEMAGLHHCLDAHEFGWTPGVGDGQMEMVCCDSWGQKESDMTEWLNWTEYVFYVLTFHIKNKVMLSQNTVSYKCIYNVIWKYLWLIPHGVQSQVPLLVLSLYTYNEGQYYISIWSWWRIPDLASQSCEIFPFM